MLASRKRSAVVGSIQSQGSRKRNRSRAALHRAVAEALECRQLLSVSGATVTGPSQVPENTSAVYQLSATDDTGNGTTWQQILPDGSYGGAFSVDEGQTYQYNYNAGDEGSDSLAFHVTDSPTGCCGSDQSDTPYDTSPQDIQITDSALTFQNATGASAVEGDGSSTIVIGTLIDPDPGASTDDYAGTQIQWGDGTAPSDAQFVPTDVDQQGNPITQGSAFLVEGQHAYAEAGTPTASTNIQDDGGQPASGSTQVAVTPVVPQVTICDNSDGSEDPDPSNPSAGTKPVALVVSRTPDADGNYSGSLVVNVAVTGGTAASSRYEAPPSSVTIPDGQASAEYDIKPIDDDIIQGDQTVDVTVEPSGSGSGGAAYLCDGSSGSETAEGTIHDNDFTISGETVTFANSQSINKDDGSGAYSSPQWVDGNADGVPDANAEAYDSTVGAPVSYVANGPDFPANITVHVEMQINAGPNATTLPPGNYTINGSDQGALGLTWEGEATANGTTLDADITSDQPLPSTIFNGDLKIQWTVTRSVEGLTDTEHGTESQDHLYVTGAAADGAFETVLDVGCRNANGISPTSQDDVLDSIYSDFETRAVYAADGTTALSFAHDNESGFTTASLVQNDRGRCGAWGHFLVDVLTAQGVPAQAVEITPILPWTDAATGLPATGGGIIVVDAPAQGSGDSVYHTGGGSNTISGHVFTGTEFNDHVMVETSLRPGWVYDPSYGTYETPQTIGGLAVSGEQMWEHDHLQGVFYTFDPAGGADAIVQSGYTKIGDWHPYTG
jgi:hypothetical protein